MREQRSCALVSSLLVVAVTCVWASAGAAARTVTAVQIEGAPTLDGKVLGDPAWARVPPTDGFTQVAPDEGAAGSERTAVRIAYNGDTLFVGVVCYDREPSGIVVVEGRRDSDLDNTDNFRILFDTFKDGQNGFVFATSPAGLEYDGQLTAEGTGSGAQAGGGAGARVGVGQQVGSGGGFNLNWDGSWQVRASITDVGWSAEFAIPFRTLRYPSADVQTWGVNFQRDIRRRQETSYWAPIPRQFNLNRVSMAGQLEALKVPPQRNLKIAPYVLGQSVHRSASGRTVGLGDAGGDLKYSLTPSMTLDLTYNTDFAQVEVDEEQVNLDRFALFFPEKRPFFLENAGLFSIGQPGQVEAFFSRRIGISPSGTAIPIIGGARLQGNVSGLNVGVLNMQTERAAGQPSNNFSVARVRRDLPNRSNVGAMFGNRQATGDLAPDDDWQRTFAVDGRLGVGKRGTLSAYAISLQTPHVPEKEYAYSGTASYDTRALRMSLGYGEVTPAFSPQIGFAQRSGFRRVSGSVFTTFRPARLLKLQELRPHASHFTYVNFTSGVAETGYTHLDNHWEFRSGDTAHTGVNITKEFVAAPFEIVPGVIVRPGTYDHREAQLALWTNSGRPVSTHFDVIIGGFFGGSRVQYGPSLNLKMGDRFTTGLALSRNDVELPVGSFVTNVVRTRLSYSFTPRIFVQTLLQYNDRADLWSTNLRFGLLSEANTGLFVVYNDTRELDHVVLRGAGRSLTIKYSRLIDVLR